MNARAPRFLLAICFLAAGWAQAQTFPSQPVRILVGFPAGGGFDVASRLIAVPLGKELGHPVLVENRPGAGGYIAARAAASAPADGHTLYACGIATHGIGPAIYRRPAADAVKDFAPISMIGSNPNVLVVNPWVPVHTPQDFIAWAKAGNRAYASPGAGTAPQLTMEMVKHSAGIDIVAVTYKGDSPALQDVIGGHVPAMIGGVGQHLAAIKAGMTRPIAVTSLKRHPALPDVPTLNESVLPGFNVLSWVGLCAPAGTTDAVTNRLNAAMVKALQDPAVRASLVQANWDPEPMSRREFAAYIQGEIARWQKVAQDAGINPE
jgi:tripartite-type tricarboxylate transporter receptor subunit TctC